MGFWEDLFGCCGGGERVSSKPSSSRPPHNDNIKALPIKHAISDEDRVFLERVKKIAASHAEREKKRGEEYTNKDGKVVSGADWDDVLPQKALPMNNEEDDDGDFEFKNPLLKGKHLLRHFDSSTSDYADENDVGNVDPDDTGGKPTYSDMFSIDTVYGNFGETNEFENPLQRSCGVIPSKMNSPNKIKRKDFAELKDAANKIFIKSVNSDHAASEASLRSSSPNHNNDANGRSSHTSAPATSPYLAPGERFRKSVVAGGKRSGRRKSRTKKTPRPFVAD